MLHRSSLPALVGFLLSAACDDPAMNRNPDAKADATFIADRGHPIPSTGSATREFYDLVMGAFEDEDGRRYVSAIENRYGSFDFAKAMGRSLPRVNAGYADHW